jgi:hypothetical protein
MTSLVDRLIESQSLKTFTLIAHDSFPVDSALSSEGFIPVKASE